MDIWGLTFVVIILAVGFGEAEEWFSVVWILCHSMDLECITALTHSKYDFIAVSPTPRFSFLHKIHLVFLLRSFCSLNLFNAKATNIHLIATKQFFK